MTEQEKIRRAREAFQRGEEFDESWVRSDILDSWKRSRDYGLTGRTADKSVMPEEEVQARIKQRALFYNIACPFMEQLYDFTTDSGYLTAISDEEGYILKVFGDDEIMSLAAANDLVVGCNRDEKKLGTNGVGTALTLGMPIQVSGEEHYFQLHHNWVCSGAPVYGPNGNEAGMVCIIGTSDKVSFHTLGMVAAAAEAITRQMVMSDAYDESERIQNRMKVILETTPSGLLLLDKDLRVSQINNKASELLSIDPEELIGRSIWEIIEKTPKNEKNVTEGASDWDVMVETGGQQMELSLTVSPTEMGEKVITFVQSEALRKKATRLVGTDVRYTFEEIIGHSVAIRDTIAMAKIAAKLSTNLLLLGENGTGKELIAQAIHNGGDRSNEPFIAINCGAIPKNLIETELFGFEGGTDDGRDGRAGKFELANGGTIFLEEISAMPFDVQASLFNVLQEGEISRLGSSKRMKINVRVIAASSKDLLLAVRNNEFHGALYYRLNGLSIHVPALRDRRGDVRLLADYFLHKYAAYSAGKVKGFSEGAFLALENYSWPGNIRELENAVERAVYVTTREYISRDCLPGHIILSTEENGTFGDIEYGGHGKDSSIQRREQRQIEETLKKCNGNISMAAEMLGISRRTIYRKMEKYGIDAGAMRHGGAIK